MADISKISIPGNSTPYNLKDATAREAINNLGNVSALSTNGSTTQFLRGDGTWGTPEGSSGTNQLTDDEYATFQKMLLYFNTTTWGALLNNFKTWGTLKDGS